MESAVHTMPAMAITKNMPVGPESPNRRSTTQEIMMVSMVMPETGLRAVVAMALAATEVKKKEKSSVSARPARTAAGDPLRLPRNAATPMAETITPSRIDITEISRSVRSGPASAPPEGAQGDAERAGHDPHGFQDSEDPGRGDGAHSHEPHVAAEDLRRGHSRNGHGRRVDRDGDVAADHPDQR